MVRQADDPFVCFGAKPDKGFGLEISTWPEVGRERQSESETKGLRRRLLAKGDASGQSTPDSRETSWDEIGSRAVREDRSRWVGIPCSFVEISVEIHASVSLHMHKGMQCYITPLLSLWVNPSLIVRLFFFSRSLDCISCSYEVIFNNQEDIFIIKGFWAIVFIFIVISTIFRLICPAGHMA